MNALFTFIKKNPVALSKYVAVGTAIVDAAVTPLNKLMQHLLVIQNIDPKTQPGEKYRKSLIAAMDQVEDKEDFDKDYDFSWVNKAFGKAKDQLSNLNLTRERFQEITDISNLTNEVAKPAFKKELKITEPLQVAKKFSPDINLTGSLNMASLKEALKTLEKYATDLDSSTVEKETVSTSRQGVAVGKNKKAKARTKVTKSFKKGVFRRVTTED